MGLAGTFASLFKKFPYEKIGIRADLENDLFTINGTIEEDGTEYLVKRGGFSGVNVVNQNENNRIGFKDMVKRIKRISQSGLNLKEKRDLNGLVDAENSDRKTLYAGSPGPENRR